MEDGVMGIKEEILEIPEEYKEKEWTTNKIKIRKWTAGIKAKITDQCMQMTVVPGQKEPSKIPVQGSQYQLLMAYYQVIEAPWQVNDLQVVEDLDPDLFDWLIQKIVGINNSGIKN
jgi:hypothetical protein